MHWFWIWIALFLVVTYGFMESYRSYAPAVARPLSYVEPTVPPTLKTTKDSSESFHVEIPVVNWPHMVKGMPEPETQKKSNPKDLKRVRPLGFLQIENDVELELPVSHLQDKYVVADTQKKPSVDVFEGYHRPAKKTKKSLWNTDTDVTCKEAHGHRAILDVSASTQTSMLVHHYGPSVLKTRENPLITRQRETMDDIEDLAARQGLSVDEFLAIRNQTAQEASKEQHIKERKAEMFRREISNSIDGSEARPLTNNLAEVAGLVRDCLQHVPTNNEALAKVVLQDILRARLEARELCVKIPMASEDHIATLRFYQRSEDHHLASLAGQILSRI